MAVRDTEVGEALASGEDGVEVEHRLAHAHEHAVRERRAAVEAAEVERLVDDLRRCEVAREAHATGRAKRAVERAAGLRGDAQRAPPVAVAHQHRLDRMAVLGAEERLDRAVAARAILHNGERRERHVAGESLA